MKVSVTKSYLDLARAVIDTKLYGKDREDDSSDAIFSLMSCTYVYSYSALVSFCAEHLHQIWEKEGSRLKSKYPQCGTFEELMAGPLKEIKSALKELSEQLGIEPLHKSRANLWRELNELLKGYRDYFIHPNPQAFQEHVESTGNLQWQFPSKVAAGIMSYFHEAIHGRVPYWIENTSLKARGFDIVGI
jgi:hypothetical protein